MLRPTLHTDAYEDSTPRAVPLVFIAGPIKHWWSCWGSPEHKRYVEHRSATRSALIDAGYLTYAAWDALKGTWTPAAQAINDTAIRASSLLIVLTPRGVPADGTESETDLAHRFGVPVLWHPPGFSALRLPERVERFIGPGVPYDA